MEFFREQIINKPRKQYNCEICGKFIDGKHYYISGKHYDFFYYRAHLSCYELLSKACVECPDSWDCENPDFQECINNYLEDIKFKKNYNKRRKNISTKNC